MTATDCAHKSFKGATLRTTYTCAAMSYRRPLWQEYASRQDHVFEQLSLAVVCQCVCLYEGGLERTPVQRLMHQRNLNNSLSCPATCQQMPVHSAVCSIDALTTRVCSRRTELCFMTEPDSSLEWEHITLFLPTARLLSLNSPCMRTSPVSKSLLMHNVLQDLMAGSYVCEH